MKLLYSIIILSVFSVAAFAQNISVVSKSSDSISGPDIAEMEAKVKIENIGSLSQTYNVIRNELSMVPGHSSYYCWSIDCYPPNVDTSTSQVTLAPGASDSTFIAYLTPYDNQGKYPGTSVVRYRIYNIDSDQREDTLGFVFVYTALNTTSLETKILSDEEVYAYPNPAVDKLNIAFGDLHVNNARIIIRNLLGSQIITRNINPTSNFTSVDVSQLDKGIYFYTLEANGEKIHTRKFAVSK